MLELETMQLEPNGMVMLALTSITSTPSVVGLTLESTWLELLAELLLLTPLGNLCPTGATGTLVIAAMLAPMGAMSTPFGTFVAAYGAIARTPTAGTIMQPMSDKRCKHTSRSSQAGAIRHCKHIIRDGRRARAGTAGATQYTGWLGLPNISGWRESLHMLVKALRLAPSGNMHLTCIMRWQRSQA